MDCVVAFLPTLWRRFRGRTDEGFSGNLEFIFYVLHVVSVISCIIIPYALGRQITPFIILAAFSCIYTLLLYSHFRYKLRVHFNLLLNSGFILVIISIILFEIGITTVASIMLVIGLVPVAIFCITVAFGCKVMVGNEDRESNQLEMANRYCNQPQEEANGQVNQPGPDIHLQQEVSGQVDQAGPDNHPQKGANVEADQAGQNNEPQQEAYVQADKAGQDNQPKQGANVQSDQPGQDNQPQQEAGGQANPLSDSDAIRLVLPDGHVLELVPLHLTGISR